ncbi:esterase [Shewanella sp. 202IG2-18]|uniref:alpha/beta hydrolase n=1 Tax=Parashewanella hymeniacidonis TaxID=2807618 RepID=UPI0019600865|nr:alpha/beta hydrolase-fold protein [Parashewanella hymeniacidonis]MBM7073303.1 esterase [Parashewanella hymeniacidonis]
MKRILLIGLLTLQAFIVNAADLVIAKEVKLDSKALSKNRQLYVSLPHGYESSDQRYPAIYLLHGQRDILPALATIDLISNQLPKFIVIGVQSRGKELKPIDGKTSPFERYLSEEVVPFVNSKYRIAPFSILSGHSNSGRFVLDFWLKNTKTFSQYYAFSASLDDGYISNKIEQLKNSELQKLAPVVITIADEGEHMQAPFNEIQKRLEFLPNLSIGIKKFPEQSHQSTKHPSMKFALETTFKGWEPSYETKISGVKMLKKHYKKLSSRFGFTVTPPENLIPRIIAYHAMSDDKNSSVQVGEHVKYTIELPNEDISNLIEIADYFSDNENPTAGKIILEEICKIDGSIKRCQL